MDWSAATRERTSAAGRRFRPAMGLDRRRPLIRAGRLFVPHLSAGAGSDQCGRVWRHHPHLRRLRNVRLRPGVPNSFARRLAAASRRITRCQQPGKDRLWRPIDWRKHVQGVPGRCRLRAWACASTQAARACCHNGFKTPEASTARHANYAFLPRISCKEQAGRNQGQPQSPLPPYQTRHTVPLPSSVTSSEPS